MAWLQAQQVFKLESSKFERKEKEMMLRDTQDESKDGASSLPVIHTLDDDGADPQEHVAIARLGRRKAPIAAAKRSKIGIKNPSRSTSWTVV